ncbi:ribonuclease HIII [Mycoplasma sp. CSL10137]|uniref:ribonuclease HIII n=1 Tax=unclassified Mycoplasma TaxID=2683645 RepID=UPI00197BF430|nr:MULTISPECIES: ribonuclease HIII [unclassified Mycoplasma]MBN4083579.1 ribonuclease HIII [Mycoplasma sp. CSL10137]MBN4084140.1 ribonuclease HIII [Mycoplasma sp. CSL10166]MBU4692605.1 ribonuclease HIII [Mycoplasma sp. CSL7491-lung]
MFFYNDLSKINLEEYNVIGVDETGVGDYFTPIIGCVAYLPNNLKEWAIQLGVQDSKKLSTAKINFIAKELIKKINYKTYTLTQKGYNSLTSKGFNANEIKYFIHFNAIGKYSNLFLNENKFDNDIFIVDRYSTFDSILRYKEKFNFISDFKKTYELKNQVFFVTKAESVHLSVACASIIARYYLINYMNKQSEEWKFQFPLGASQKVKEAVIDFEQLYGKNSLDLVCKTSFKIK